MGKNDKSLDDLEAELAALEAELADLEKGAAKAVVKKEPKAKKEKAKAPTPAPVAVTPEPTEPTVAPAEEPSKKGLGGLAGKMKSPFGKKDKKEAEAAPAPSPEPSPPTAPAAEAAPEPKRSKFGLGGKMKLPFGKGAQKEEPPAPDAALEPSPEPEAERPQPVPVPVTVAASAPSPSLPIHEADSLPAVRGPRTLPTRSSKTAPSPIPEPLTVGEWRQEGRLWRRTAHVTADPLVVRRRVDESGNILSEESASTADLDGVERVHAPEPGNGAGYTLPWRGTAGQADTEPAPTSRGEETVTLAPRPEDVKEAKTGKRFSLPFGKKKAEATPAPEPPASEAPPAEEKREKKFRLPFGKK